MAIHNRENLDAFTPAGVANPGPAAFGRGKRRIDEALTFVEVAFLAQRVRQLRQNPAQHLTFAPLLNPSMDRLVVGIALRQHVPLRAGVQNPQHRFQDRSRRHRLAARSTLRDMFFGKMFPTALPLVVA